MDTIWYDVFEDYSKYDRLMSTAVVTPTRQLLTLPNNYDPALKYYYVGIPFNLNRDPDPDPAIATVARLRLVRSPKGTVTPYIAIGNGLVASASNQRWFAGAVAGVLSDSGPVTHQTISRHDYSGKRVIGNSGTSSTAYHWRGVTEPALIAWASGQLSGQETQKKLKYGGFGYYRFDSAEQFNQTEYNAIGTRDGANVYTSPVGIGISGNVEAALDEKTTDAQPRPLYDWPVALCWHKQSKLWYWFHADSRDFEAIPSNMLGPLGVDNLVEVAGCRDPRDGSVFLLQTRVVQVDAPPGYFDVEHRILKWLPPVAGGDVRTTPDYDVTRFVQGPWWASARLPRYYWPAQVMAPNKMEISNDKLYLIFEANWNRLHKERYTYQNYYGNALDYFWFPFRAIYTEQLMKTSQDATFAMFNPGIMGTITTVNLTTQWMPAGNAKIIQGNYDPVNNRWAALDSATLEQFEGANDKVYLGRQGSKLYFYQAFVPYDGGEVLWTGQYKDPAWRQANPNVAWNGLVVYDIETDRVTYVRGTVPFRCNVGGTFASGEAVIQGGQELIRQIYYPDTGQLIGSDSLEQDVRTEAILGTGFSFLVDRTAKGAKVTTAVSADVLKYPIAINPNDGTWRRISASQNNVLDISETSGAVDMVPDVLATPGTIVAVGGLWMQNRQAIRLRRSDPFSDTVRFWSILNFAVGSKTYASQIYVMEDVALTDPDATLRIHAKARKVDGLPFPLNALPSAAAPQEISLFVYRDPDWVEMELTSKTGDEYVWESTVGQIPNAFEDALVLRINAPPQYQAGIETDYIYAEMTIESNEYNYEWANLPQGGQGVVVLECSNSSQVDLGVEVKTVRAVINSSY